MSPAAGVVTLALAALGATAIAIRIGRVGVVLVVTIFVVGLLLTQWRSLAFVAGERAPIRRALAQAWWAPVAAVLGVVVVAAGIGTVFDAHNLP